MYSCISSERWALRKMLDETHLKFKFEKFQFLKFKLDVRIPRVDDHMWSDIPLNTYNNNVYKH